MGEIGSVKVQTKNHGIVSVPVFAEGDSGSDVYEFVKVKTEGGIGFIPLVSTSNASYPYLRVQTQNHGVVAVHKESSLTKIIDDFEDNDISEYTGETGYNSIDTTYVRKGGYSLKHHTNGSGGYNIYSVSGLQYYPSQGDKWRVWFYPDQSDNTIYHHFGVQDSDNYYRAVCRNDHWEWGIKKTSDGTGTNLATETVSNTPSGVWQYMEIEWQNDGTITLGWYNEDGTLRHQVSANDATFSSGGIGFGGDNYNGNSANTWFDYAHIV